MLQQVCGSHDHSGRAKSALQAMAFPKTFLQRVQLAIIGKPFNRGHLATVCLHGKHGAAFGGLAIDMDGTGAATAGITTHMRTRKPQHITQVIHQQQPWLNIVTVHHPVDVYINSDAHGCLVL